MTTTDELLSKLNTIVSGDTASSPDWVTARLTYGEIRLLLSYVEQLKNTNSYKPASVRHATIRECADRFDPSSRQPISENQAKHRLLALLEVAS